MTQKAGVCGVLKLKVDIFGPKKLIKISQISKQKEGLFEELKLMRKPFVDQMHFLPGFQFFRAEKVSKT